MQLEGVESKFGTRLLIVLQFWRTAGEQDMGQGWLYASQGKSDRHGGSKNGYLASKQPKQPLLMRDTRREGSTLPDSGKHILHTQPIRSHMPTMGGHVGRIAASQSGSLWQSKAKIRLGVSGRRFWRAVHWNKPRTGSTLICF